ncbi:hypothetical protein QN239_01480 [Mycolicibacterium sp. Y3]
MSISEKPQAESRMSAECRECAGGLAHCHGTVILHIGQRAECTDDCGVPEIAHTLTIDCAVLGCGCVADQPIGSGTGSSRVRSA